MILIWNFLKTMINIKTIAISFYNKYIGNSSYKKNVLILVGGRVLAQTIPILLTPLLARIYSPEEFGVFAVYSTIVSLIAMISNGRYCLAILLPKKDENVKNLVLISCLFTLLVSLLVLLLLILWGETFFVFLNVAILQKYFYVLILNIIFVGFHEAFFYYALREKLYNYLSINLIIQATVLITVRLVLGFLGYTEIGLVLSYLLSYFMSFLLLSVKLNIKVNIKAFRGNIKLLLKRYSNFPKFTLLSDTIGVSSYNLPSILLNKFFGSTEAGYFSISDKVLGSPIWFITSSVGDVFKQEASEQYRQGQGCKVIFVKTAKTLFLLGLVPFLLIFFFLPILVPYLFGEVWTPAGEFIRILSLMYFSSFVVNPISYVVYIINKQQYGIMFQITKLISTVIAFYVGFQYQDLRITLLLLSLLVTVSNIIIFLISYRLSNDSAKVRTSK